MNYFSIAANYLNRSSQHRLTKNHHWWTGFVAPAVIYCISIVAETKHKQMFVYIYLNKFIRVFKLINKKVLCTEKSRFWQCLITLGFLTQFSTGKGFHANAVCRLPFDCSMTIKGFPLFCGYPNFYVHRSIMVLMDSSIHYLQLN